MKQTDRATEEQTARLTRRLFLASAAGVGLALGASRCLANDKEEDKPAESQDDEAAAELPAAACSGPCAGGRAPPYSNTNWKSTTVVSPAVSATHLFWVT